MKVYIKNHQRLIKVNSQRVKRQLRKVLQLLSLDRAELSILFVNDERMKKLNARYRGVERTTDVLSFPQTDKQHLNFKTQNIILGDIVINLHKARRQAIEYNLSFYDELKRLLIHGLLHLVDYDHEKSSHHKKKMKSKEKELLTALRYL